MANKVMDFLFDEELRLITELASIARAEKENRRANLRVVLQVSIPAAVAIVVTLIQHGG